MSVLAPTLQAFFTDRLIRQRQVSPHTVASYRDTLRLLLTFAAERRSIEPSKLDIGDIEAPLVGAFLDHLERARGNGVRTRNARLAAIRSLFRYAALRHPEHAAVIERVLAIPPKRFERKLLTFLTAIIGFCAAVAGLMGMNFDMTFFKTGTRGFLAVTGSLVVISAVSVLFARRRGWL